MGNTVSWVYTTPTIPLDNSHDNDLSPITTLAVTPALAAAPVVEVKLPEKEVESSGSSGSSSSSSSSDDDPDSIKGSKSTTIKKRRKRANSKNEIVALPRQLTVGDLPLKELILASNIKTEKVAKLTLYLRYNTIIDAYNQDRDEKKGLFSMNPFSFFLNGYEKKIKEIIKFSKENIAEIKDLETLRNRNCGTFIAEGIKPPRSTHIKIDLLFSFCYHKTGISEVYDLIKGQPKTLDLLYHFEKMGKMGIDFYLKWSHVLDKYIVENKDSPAIIVENDPEIIELYQNMIDIFPSVWKSVQFLMKNKSALTNLKNLDPNTNNYCNSIQLNFNSNVSHKTFNSFINHF